MPDFNRSLIQRVAAAAWLSVALAVPAGAQQPTAPPDPGPGFMTRYDFHLSAASLAIQDQRFSWDTRFGGELDVIVDAQTALIADRLEFKAENEGKRDCRPQCSDRLKQTALTLQRGRC